MNPQPLLRMQKRAECAKVSDPSPADRGNIRNCLAKSALQQGDKASDQQKIVTQIEIDGIRPGAFITLLQFAFGENT